MRKIISAALAASALIGAAATAIPQAASAQPYWGPYHYHYGYGPGPYYHRFGYGPRPYFYGPGPYAYGPGYYGWGRRHWRRGWW